nr:MAG TPA: hypothetical protein [Caudoviricetes sp.]
MILRRGQTIQVFRTERLENTLNQDQDGQIIQ